MHSPRIRQSQVWKEYLDGVHRVRLAQPDPDIEYGSVVILAPFAKCSSEEVDRDGLVLSRIDISKITLSDPFVANLKEH